MRRPALLATLATASVAVVIASAAPASAVNTYNAAPAPERTEVGALLVQWDRDANPATPDVVDWYCSGTMIDHDVFLTASHCTTDWAPGARFYVSLAQDVEGALATAKAAGLSPAQVAAAVGVEGTEHTHPDFPGNSADSHDIAVVTFDAAQAAELSDRWAFTPAILPAAGQLDALGSRALDAARWEVMGYGTVEAQREPGGHVHPGGGVRMKAEVGFNSLNDTWVRLAMNESRGYGGACYGDSGGPNFATVAGARILVATTVTGDAPCYATNVVYRLDAPSARDFLDEFVDLP